MNEWVMTEKDVQYSYGHCVGVCGVLLSDASSTSCLGAGWLALAVLLP